MLLRILLIITSLLPLPSEGNVFSRPHKLAVLFFKEEELVREARRLGLLSKKYNYDSVVQRHYLYGVRRRNMELAPLRNSSDQETLHKHMDDILENLVGNPVHVMCLLDRLVYILPKLLQEELGLSADNMANFMRMLGKEEDLPKEGDVDAAVLALVRIQFVYKLDPLDIAQGILMGTDSKAKLSRRQMMMIAYSRFSGEQSLRPHLGKEYALALEWAEAALDLQPDHFSMTGATANEEVDQPPPSRTLHDFEIVEEQVREQIMRMRWEHDSSWISPEDQRGNLPNEEFFVRKTDGRVTGKELRAEEVGMKHKDAEVLRQGFHLHNFYTLCRGEVPVTGTTPRLPLCRLTNRNDFYFLLRPLREEEVSLDPLVLVFHDFLSEGEIRLMKDQAMSDMAPATVQDTDVPDGAGSKVSKERTQASGWLWDHNHPTLYSLSQKVGRLANLEVARPPDKNVEGGAFVESEAWQVGAYTPGGHYLPHYDAFDILDPQSRTPDDLWVGNRVATLMLYLSDSIGGSTAFPKLGVAVKPKSGSALFWFNLLLDGSRDDRSFHGACPTVKGIKWVSNKWIREGAQIWRRPCA